MDTSPETMTERHARILGRLAEIGMALVEDLAGAALAAEAASEKAALASACHRLSRSVRQSLALEARFTRDAARARHEADQQAQAGAAQAPARRRAEAKARLDRLIWTEAEDETTARFWDEGAGRLLAEAEFTDPDTPVEALIDRLAATLRDAEPRTGKPGKPETVIFEWKIIDPKRDGEAPPPTASPPPPPPAAEEHGPRSSPEQRGTQPEGPEGAEAHAALHSDPAEPPDAAHVDPDDPAGPAPPEDEPPPTRRRWPYGLPGEFGPNGETGEDRVPGCL